MNTEEDEFRRIETEAKRRAAGDEDDDTQVCAKPWVGLTDEEIIDVIHPLVMADMPDEATDYEIARAIEAKLKEKNNG
jgi:hypothetical protein